MVTEIGIDLYALSDLVKEKIEKKDLKDTKNSNEDQKEDNESEKEESEKEESEKEEKIIADHTSFQLKTIKKNEIKYSFWNIKFLLANAITSVKYSPPERL
jgi:CO dehydrogenase/acetyl-CoA synthase beta subunit